MNVLVSGSSGLVGSALVADLERRGDRIFKLVRGRATSEREAGWDVETGEIEAAKLKGANSPDVVVHLAGENIGNGRWTEQKKRRIRDSRVPATEKLVASLLKLPERPKVFASASAIGFYGDRGDEILTEESGAGEGFMAEVVKGWEEATKPLAEAGVRVAHGRFGLIVSGEGGALPKMVLPFRFGVGGKLGSGCQWLNWVARRDVVRALLFLMDQPELSGPFNVVSPEPVRNADWTKALGEVMHRPALMKAPEFALRLVLGEMADALLLISQRVIPKRLMEAGFSFEEPELKSALEKALG